MHHIEKIIVRGFRGQQSLIELNLKPDANFVIGRNGTGKTTLINLIHAALALDLPTLRESSFDKIEFILSDPNTGPSRDLLCRGQYLSMVPHALRIELLIALQV